MDVPDFGENLVLGFLGFGVGESNRVLELLNICKIYVIRYVLEVWSCMVC